MNSNRGMAAKVLNFSIPLNPLIAVEAIMIPPSTANTGTLRGMYLVQICPKKPNCVANQPTDVKQIIAEKI